MKKFDLTFEFDGKLHTIEVTPEQVGLICLYSSISAGINTSDEHEPLWDFFKKHNKVTNEECERRFEEYDIYWDYNEKKYRLELIFNQWDDTLEIYLDNKRVASSNYVITEKND